MMEHITGFYRYAILEQLVTKNLATTIIIYTTTTSTTTTNNRATTTNNNNNPVDYPVEKALDINNYI